MNLSAFIPVVNRPDMLKRVLSQIPELWDYLTVIDNSAEGIGVDARVRFHRLLVPMTFTQSMNFEFESALHKGSDFLIHAHSDADIPKGAVERLINFTEEVIQSGRKWSVIYSHYDIFCAYNPECYRAIGGFDTNIRAYKSDQDWYRRCDLAGWERINSGIECGHGVNGQGSQTINSDPKEKFIMTYLQQIDTLYYSAKWGGDAGKEIYTTAFNRKDLFGE